MGKITLEIFVHDLKLFMLKTNGHDYYKDNLDSIIFWPYE